MERPETTKLEPCPACRGACVWLDEGGLIECQELDDKQLRTCGYIFVDTYDSKSTTIEAHNALSRQAETGRLVEQLLSKVSPISLFNDSEESDFVAFYYPANCAGRTLLDALRNLAAWVEDGMQVPEGVRHEIREAKVEELDRLRAIAAKYQHQWQRLLTRLEEIPASGLGPGGRVRLDREHVIMALDLDKPVPWVDESETDEVRARYKESNAERVREKVREKTASQGGLLGFRKDSSE